MKQGMKLIVVLLVVIGAGLVTSSQAVAGSEKKSNQLSIEEYLEYQKKITKEIKQGRYGPLPDNEIRLVQKSQATIRDVLDGAETIDDLTKDEKVEAYNAQEAINSVLANQADDRQVCKRTHTVGTHRKVTQCFSRKQQSLMRNRAQDTMSFWPEYSPPPK